MITKCDQLKAQAKSSLPLAIQAQVMVAIEADKNCPAHRISLYRIKVQGWYEHAVHQLCIVHKVQLYYIIRHFQFNKLFYGFSYLDFAESQINLYFVKPPTACPVC